MRKTSAFACSLLLMIGSASAIYISGVERVQLDSDPEVAAWVNEAVSERGREISIEVTGDPTLLVRSKAHYGCPVELYDWCFDRVVELAEMGNYMGDSYTVDREGDLYRGDDGSGLVVDFFAAHRSREAVVYTGQGTLTVKGIPSSGSFVNVIEFEALGERMIRTRSTIFVRIDNGLKRFLARVVFAVSDLEETVKEKLFELDETVVKVLNQLLDDPALLPLLSAPATADEEAAWVTLEARMAAEDEPKKEKKRRSRRGRPRGGREVEAAETQPVAEAPLILSTHETAAYMRDRLPPEDIERITGILSRWYAGEGSTGADEIAGVDSDAVEPGPARN